jgi:Na+/alanine symporter
MVSANMGESASAGRHAHFPAPSLTVFIALQLLDIFTTLLGLQLGAREGSIFLGRLMRAGPLAALLIAKIIAVLLVAMAIRFKRPRVVVFLNYWLAAVVSWNLIIILMSQLSALRRD